VAHHNACIEAIIFGGIILFEKRISRFTKAGSHSGTTCTESSPECAEKRILNQLGNKGIDSQKPVPSDGHDAFKAPAFNITARV
jgi:hypothetical protein